MLWGNAGVNLRLCAGKNAGVGREWFLADERGLYKRLARIRGGPPISDTPAISANNRKPSRTERFVEVLFERHRPRLRSPFRVQETGQNSR